MSKGLIIRDYNDKCHDFQELTGEKNPQIRWSILRKMIELDKICHIF
jgi:hypothetical protein